MRNFNNFQKADYAVQQIANDGDLARSTNMKSSYLRPTRCHYTGQEKNGATRGITFAAPMPGQGSQGICQESPGYYGDPGGYGDGCGDPGDYGGRSEVEVGVHSLVSSVVSSDVPSDIPSDVPSVAEADPRCREEGLDGESEAAGGNGPARNERTERIDTAGVVVDHPAIEYERHEHVHGWRGQAGEGDGDETADIERAVCDDLHHVQPSPNIKRRPPSRPKVGKRRRRPASARTQGKKQPLQK